MQLNNSGRKLKDQTMSKMLKKRNNYNRNILVVCSKLYPFLTIALNIINAQLIGTYKRMMSK